jgi:menaquinone-9 beta-reductase
MDFDVAIIGGGLAGSSLGIALAKAGAHVLIVEREAQFRDRVRGEGMLPWGAAEARELGIHQPLLDACAIESRWMTTPDDNRDLITTTPSGLGCLNFYHPEMQQSLLDMAVATGVELWRPAEAAAVVPGETPTVAVRRDGRERRVTARLVVGADGRNSRVRSWAGFSTKRDPVCLTACGVLYRNLAIPEDAVQIVVNPPIQRLSIIFPLGGGRFRAYVVVRHGSRPPLSGAKDFDAFVECSVETGAPATWFAGSTAVGPLASFDAPDAWADFPHRDGAVLIGDAAAASDPSFGCGLSLTLRDVRTLRDRLAETDDWRTAADAYSAEHDRYRADLRRVHSWYSELWFGIGSAAETMRARVLPLLTEDPTRLPDFIGLGPEAPSDELARRRMFGEE